MKLIERQKGHIEGYAQALTDIEFKLTGYNHCGKHYDPMTVVGENMMSYAFDMKEGGRRHPLMNYSGIDDILKTVLEEAEDNIRYSVELKMKKTYE